MMLVEAGRRARVDGYVFMLDSDEINPHMWPHLEDDLFDTVIITVEGTIVGARRIDGVVHHVMKTDDGDIVAVLPQNVEYS